MCVRERERECVCVFVVCLEYIYIYVCMCCSVFLYIVRTKQTRSLRIADGTQFQKQTVVIGVSLEHLPQVPHKTNTHTAEAAAEQ